MRFSDPFREAGFWSRVGDYQFRLTCSCGAALTLDACPLRERGAVTVYACPQCGAELAGVTEEDRAAPGAPPPPTDDDGHRMCGYVFGTRVELELWQPAATDAYLEIPPRPGFFSSRGLD